MRIGVFGGSFDPVHTEHIALARRAKEELGLEKLFVMPAFAPPHKSGRTLSPDRCRLELCRLAFEGIDGVFVSDYEISRGGTSYTYLTLRHFRSLYPDAELFFLVGTDMLRDFPTWKRPEEILSLATLAVCARAEEVGWRQKEGAAFEERFGQSFAVIPYEGKDISSTKIRVLAGAGEDLTPFVGEKAAAYIRENRLYEIFGATPALAMEKPNRRAHSVRVALLAAKRANSLKIPEKQAIQAALLHDCAKNLSADSPYLEGFTPPKGVPPAVLHQYAGAFVAKTVLGVTDEEVLSAIECHTSGKVGMSKLDKLIFLADLVEEERSYEGVELLRKLFWEDLDECLRVALQETVKYLKRGGGEIYQKTLDACEYYQKKENKE
ncbi:MAG: nicotinate (nicotinamide) nucleotide adenylyltransferase [Clostridia bacterium]|nr:nicotinate (nicotinamide) nucleotide adenylyltransferase [Clostridia bacterium]